MRFSIGFVILGVVFLVTGFQLVHFGDQPEFNHRVEQVSQSTYEDMTEEPENAERQVTHQFKNLTTQTQSVVQKAIDSPGKTVTLRGAGKGLPEFVYPGDTSDFGYGKYFIKYGDEYYELSTFADRGFAGLPELVIGVLCLGLGIALIFIGLRRCENSKLTVSVLVGGGVFILIAITPFDWFGFTGLLELIGVGLLFYAISSALMWSFISIAPENSETTS